MSRLRLVKAIELERLLLRLEFVLVRQKGSHRFYRHPNGRTTTILFHIGKDLRRQLIHTVLKDINISVEEYNNVI